MPSPLTLILSYYRQPQMLAMQLSWMKEYRQDCEVLIVDDASPEPAESVIRAHASPALLSHLRLYRILQDVPWNREMARNLGAQEAQTEWLAQMDLDHVLVVHHGLLAFDGVPGHWYRFPRWRVGTADATRLKDQIPCYVDYGQIHPHVDSYLVQRAVYWEAGGYDEDFSGVLGGGGEFLARLERTAGPPLLVPDPVKLHVYTRTAVADASDQHCSRDTAPGKALWRQKQRQGLPKPTSWCRLPWERVL